jgi:hypothetical protein
MEVDFSGWLSRPGLVMGEYRYSKMAPARDCIMEIHFDIMPGVIVYTIPTFMFSNLDLPPRETPLRGSLRPMDGSESIAMMSMIGRRNDQGDAVIGMLGSNDQDQCLRMFVEGKPMHLAIDFANGERLVRLPVPNTPLFKEIYHEARERVRGSQ